MNLDKAYHAAVVQSCITVEKTEYNTYGIEICYGEDHTVVYDISVDRAKVEALCRRVREGRLAPCHLQAVVEDFLNG